MADESRFRARPEGALRCLFRGFDHGLEWVCMALLVSTAAVTLLQVFYRYVLNASLAWPEEVARWAFVWAVFLGMAVNVGRRSHIAIDLVTQHLTPRIRPWHTLLVNATITGISLALVVHGGDLVARSTYVSPAMGWPFTYFYLALPLGAALNIFYLLRQRDPGESWLFSGAAGVVLGACVYFALMAWGEDLFGDFATSSTLMVVALVMIGLGLPIAFALAFASFVSFVPEGDLLLMTISQNMTSALDSFTLMAIPFFILAANIMNVGGITHRLVALATTLVGHLRGGLAHVNVLTNLMMAGLSGSSAADAAAITKTMVPEMEARGYPRAFGCALTSSSGVLANLIPPSMGLIIYGALASVSVGALFVGTILPGLVMAASLSLVVHGLSIRRGFGRDTERASGGERMRALVIAMPALMLPILIVGGVRFGAFTATEAGAVAVMYAFVCGIAFYRQITPGNLLVSLREALWDTVAIMVIIAAAAPFAWVLVTGMVPQTIAASLGPLANSPTLLLMVINVLLLLTGLFMEMIAAMVILVPILVPIVKAAGIDLVHFGIVLVVNLVIGALTPPMGMLIFTTARVGQASVTAVFREVMPFLFGMIFSLILISYIPWLSLILTRIIGS